MLNLEYCHSCLKSLQGLQAIASHCPNLKELNVHVSKVEDRILLWEVLSDMKLTYLAIEFCILRLDTINKEKLINY